MNGELQIFAIVLSLVSLGISIYGYMRIQNRNSKVAENFMKLEAARLKELHDRDGHIWLNATNHESTEYEFVCAYCDASKTEPFEQAE